MDGYRGTRALRTRQLVQSLGQEALSVAESCDLVESFILADELILHAR